MDFTLARIWNRCDPIGRLIGSPARRQLPAWEFEAIPDMNWEPPPTPPTPLNLVKARLASLSLVVFFFFSVLGLATAYTDTRVMSWHSVY